MGNLSGLEDVFHIPGLTAMVGAVKGQGFRCWSLFPLQVTLKKQLCVQACSVWSCLHDLSLDLRCLLRKRIDVTVALVLNLSPLTVTFCNL